jgi:hypothetical protein
MIALDLKKSDGITDKAYMMAVYESIARNRNYIKSVTRNSATRETDVVSKILIHAITHRDYTKTDALDAYVKALANAFTKELYKETARQTEFDDNVSAKYGQYAFDMTTECDAEGRYTIENVLMQYYFKYPDDVERYCLTVLHKLGIRMYCDFVVDADGRHLVEVDDINKSKDETQTFTPIDKTAWQDVRAVMKRYDATTVLNATLIVANKIAAQKHRLKRVTKLIPIVAHKVDYDILSAITGVPTVAVIKGSNQDNRIFEINPCTLEMYCKSTQSTVNLDIVKWQPLKKSMTSVVKIDIIAFMEYIYTQVCVPQGVNTALIKWLKKENIKILPSGVQLLNVTLEHYIVELKAELLTTLSKNGITDIIGITADAIYFRPRRLIKYNNIQYKLYTGKIINMPVQVVE